MYNLRRLINIRGLTSIKTLIVDILPDKLLEGFRGRSWRTGLYSTIALINLDFTE